MKALPLSIGIMHFVGIGGIGMSGIAEVLHNLGYEVRGSDIADSANVKRLRKNGIDVFVGHEPENVADAAVVVISSAVKDDNPELIEARKRMIPIVKRAEMLAELMRLKWSISIAGTHGKTTTTSIVAALLDEAKLDPTVINGGIINAYGTNARLGAGDWLVAEADESDGTFLRLPSTVVAVTNIDPEHMEHYGSFDNLQDAFVRFIENIPFYGFAALCVDHPVVQSLIPKLDRRIVTYGFSPQADIRGILGKSSLKGTEFDIEISERLNNIGDNNGKSRKIEKLFFPMQGEHNIQNAMAAIAISLEMGFSDDIIRNGLKNFGGVKRRFTCTGTVNNITIIDDYAHHPVEITAVLSAARAASKGKVIAVMQPHRYTRLNDLFEEFSTCFNDADTVLVTDIYAAGEEPIEGCSQIDLVESLRTHGHKDAIALPQRGDLASMVSEIAKSGDIIICLGAGSISLWAQSLPQELKEILGEKA